jgi:hypothetical protein
VISRDKSKLQAYCDLGKLHDETQQAVEDNDPEAIGVPTAKTMPSNNSSDDKVIDGLDKVDLSSNEGQELTAAIPLTGGCGYIAPLVRAPSIPMPGPSLLTGAQDKDLSTPPNIRDTR